MSDPRAQVDSVDEEAAASSKEPVDRNRDLLGRANSACRKHLDKVFDKLVNGFESQASRSDDLDKWWNCYNCELDDNQFYNGNATVYVPIIRDAVNARATRFVNQLFPASGRYIDCTSSDGSQPLEVIALANHHIGAAKLKTQVVKPLLRNGDIEGQYNLYVGWNEYHRQIVSRETHGVLVPEDGGYAEAEGDEIEDVRIEDVKEGVPLFEVLHDSDVLILPATADSVEDALMCGGAVVIVRRWSKDDVQRMTDSGEIRRDETTDIDGEMLDAAGMGSSPGLSDIAKQLVKAVGIRTKGPHALVFETWTMLPLNDSGEFAKDGTKRLCRVWFGVNRQQLGAKRNPYWNDRCPLMSVPVEKVAGVSKGKSLIEALAPLQWEANDAANERADADHYGAMPIIMRKPGEGNSPLVLNLAAIWDTDPNTTKFAEFPDLSQRARARVQDATTLIFQSLGVNPAMLPQQTGKPGTKRSQGEIALEQSVDLLTTAEAVSVVSEGILDPVAAWVIDLDHQFRDADLTVRAYGEMGVLAEMIDVPPIQNRKRYQFIWCGAEQAKLNVAMMQSGTQLINVARGMAQQLQAEGYQLRLGPILERAFVNVFGPQTGSQVLVDQRRQLTVQPELENEMLQNGFAVPVHVLDDDAAHIQAHVPLLQQTSDPHGNIRVHVQEHLKQQGLKNAAMAQQQLKARAGAQGVPGGGGPGVAGTPRPGAMPAQQRPAQQPPGARHADQMPAAGVVQMPRKVG